MHPFYCNSFYLRAGAMDGDPSGVDPTPGETLTGGFCQSCTISLQLTIAREQAVLGEYATATVYYDGVLAQIQRHTRCVRSLLHCAPDCPAVNGLLLFRSLSPGHLHLGDSWSQCKRSIEAELDQVKELEKELAALKASAAGTPSPGHQRAGGNVANPSPLNSPWGAGAGPAAQPLVHWLGQQPRQQQQQEPDPYASPSLSPPRG